MKIFKSRCYNGGNRHKFQAVYEDTEAPWVRRLEMADRLSRSIMFENCYVKHVCVWCGKEVKR